MKYTCILFDADETLFDFNKLAGLKRLFHSYGVDFSKLDYERYDLVNQQLWTQYQAHEIDADTLQIERFNEWSARLQVPAMQLNNEFLDAMAEICQPLSGVRQLLNHLRGKVQLGIITNGFARMQHKRIAHTGFEDYFDALVISEEVGKAKPHPSIFEHTFSLLGNPPKQQILMVGDNISTDILGGINAGVDTCWLRHPNVANNTDIKPTYTIENMLELIEIV